MAKTVMIVEDNELNMKLFHDLLEAYGYRTIGTRNGFEVPKRLRGLSVKADLGVEVHRDHPPPSRGRPEYASR
jgi:CheY-like chemotaxis protein